MRALSGAVIVLAGAVMTTMQRGDYMLGYAVILIGFLLLAVGWAMPERRLN
jgi:hypothetical protein